ncbi:MAG: MarR family transcriptional regulator [Gammaproteobacteria bacterium]|jgi:DNA-binding MarR family transcriptional regulator|nr:MarR family transcriptional regulator [Gammaproteobacteria bacterium]
MEDQPPEVLMRGLLRAYYWMDESLQNGLVQAGFQPRTRTQTMILINISNGITRAAELARVLGVSRQAIQQQINELERDDLVTQIPDPEDRRANRIVFSEKGSRLISAALETLREAEQALAMRLGYDAVRHLRNALTADWGDVIGGTHPRGRKRSLAERGSEDTGTTSPAGPAGTSDEASQDTPGTESGDRSAGG